MSVRVGIISDTHNVLRPEVLEVLEGCDYILHAGDITEEKILDQIRFMGRLYVVRGNCDRSWAHKLEKKQIFRIEGLNFLMVHNQMNAGRDVENADVIIFGHTHRYHEEIRDGKLWLNPGSCGMSRFGGSRSMAVMTVDCRDYKVEMITI